MSKSAVSVEEKDLGEGRKVFHLEGNLHGDPGAYAFQDAVRESFKAGFSRVIFDLGKLERIDSCGLGILAASVVSAKNANATIVLCAANPRIQKLLDLVWPLDFVEQAETLADALY